MSSKQQKQLYLALFVLQFVIVICSVAMQWGSTTTKLDNMHSLQKEMNEDAKAERIRNDSRFEKQNARIGKVEDRVAFIEGSMTKDSKP